MGSIEDIVAEMRDLAANRDWHNHTNQSNRERLLDYADCIEKAVANCNQFKMREALKQAQRVLHCAIVAGILKGEDAHEALNVVTAALSAPPRNCDLVEGRTADDEFEKAMGFPPSKTADERDNLMRENWFLFKAWLFAEAKGDKK